MELKKVWAVYYSATGTTAKVVRTAAEALAERLGLPMEERSFTRPVERAAALAFTAADLVVVGSPTYAGKLPNKILRTSRRSSGETGPWRCLWCCLATGALTTPWRSCGRCWNRAGSVP